MDYSGAVFTERKSTQLANLDWHTIFEIFFAEV
jgi:hypothetical protein